MMNEHKKVAIFMNLFRSEETMHVAINSILNQTYRNLEFFISVSDLTIDVVNRYAADDNRVHAVYGMQGIGNREFFKKQVEMVQASSSAYVARIDADDWCDKRYIEKLVDFAEQNFVDIVACGTVFMNETGTRELGSRGYRDLAWNTKDTNVEDFIFSYRMFGTTWAKLISSELIINQDISKLPDADEYGRYGGDTIWVFNLIRKSKRVGTISALLYYYRTQNKQNDSNVLGINRLKSDEFLYKYVLDVMNEVGCLGKEIKEYLLLIYATGKMDTLNLIIRASLTENEKAKLICELFSDELSKEFLSKETNGGMAWIEGQDNPVYRTKYFETITSYVEEKCFDSRTVELYFSVCSNLFPEALNKLCIDEFAVLFEKKTWLNLFICERYVNLYTVLMLNLEKSKVDRRAGYISLLKKLTISEVAKYYLGNINFVISNKLLFLLIQNNQYEEVFETIHEIIKNKTDKLMLEFWNNLAAEKEDANEYIVSKELFIEELIKNNKMDEARIEYNEVCEMGFINERLATLLS